MSDIKIPKEICKIIYADDLTLITSNINLDEAKNNLEHSLNIIREWSEKWDLKINPTKSKIMCFTNKKNRTIPNNKNRKSRNSIYKQSYYFRTQF